MMSPVKIWRNQTYTKQLLGKTGTIVSWTLVRVPPAGFAEQAPYPVVLVALTTGERIEAQLVDWHEADLAFGVSVITVVRRVMQPDLDGIIPYGIKVKPL